MKNLDRRQFLKGSLLATASIGMAGGFPAADRGQESVRESIPISPPEDIVDTNVNLSRWPFRRIRGDTTSELVDMLAGHGVTQAWAGSYDGLLHKNVSAVNARLAGECSSHDMLVPFGTINPKLPGWEEDLRRCHEEHGMRGIRLHPNYHQYTLDETVFARLLERTAERGMIVQLAVVMEDSRTQHPLVRVPVVDLEPLPPLLKGMPEARVVIQNNRSNVSRDVLRELVDTSQVYMDMARVEGVGAVSRVLQNVPDDRVVFGSHAPYFYHMAALLKMEGSELTQDQISAIARKNARRLIGRA